MGKIRRPLRLSLSFRQGTSKDFEFIKVLEDDFGKIENLICAVSVVTSTSNCNKSKLLIFYDKSCSENSFDCKTLNKRISIYCKCKVVCMHLCMSCSCIYVVKTD